MVSRSYLTDKPAPVSRPRIMIDQTVVPALIDLAGHIEAVLERLAVRTRAAPLLVTATAFGCGALLGIRLSRGLRS